MSELLKALLEKAGHKSLASHFKKVAAHHEKKAKHHEDVAAAHEEVADHYEKSMKALKAEDPTKDHHKVKHAFHKSMSSHHEKAAKHHEKMAEHYHKASAAHESMDAEKIAKAWEFELEKVADSTPTPDPVAKTDPPAPVVKTDPAPNTGGDSVNKAVEEKVDKLVDVFTKFLEKASTTPDPAAKQDPKPNPVPEPTSLEKKLDALTGLLTKFVEKGAAPTTGVDSKDVDLAQLSALLGTTVGRPTIQLNTPTGLKTFAVPRTGDISKATGTEVDAVPDEFKELVKIEHIE